MQKFVYVYAITFQRISLKIKKSPQKQKSDIKNDKKLMSKEITDQ